uniref:Uncharacterized protein n=1 Tax=Zea mays TaxID=4577 RepID=A0A804NT11_MAIZE
PPPRLFWLLASLSVAEQTCAVTARHRHHFIQCPLWLCVSINLSVCFPAFWCRTASRPLLLFRASSPPGDDGPKLRRGQRETPAGSLRQGEAEAVQVGRRAAVALLLPCARRRRPAPELLRGRPPPAAVGIAEGATLVERRGRRRRPARGAGARRAGRRGCGGGDQEGGLRSGVRAAAPVPLAAGRRHGDDAGREQRAIQGQHPTRNPTGHAAVHGGARDPRTAAPTGFVYGRRWIATRPSGSGPRRDGARCADDDGRVARGDVGRRRARQAHGQVSARGDENTGLGKPATAKGGAANEGGRGQGGEDEATGAGEDGEQAGLGAGGCEGEARAGGGQAEPARRAGRQGGRAQADRPPAVLLLRVLAQAAADVQMRADRGGCGTAVHTDAVQSFSQLSC